MGRIRSVKILALFAAASICSGAGGVHAAPAPSVDDALRQIEAYAPQALEEQGAPGMSVAITDRTHTLRILTVGFANLDAKIPVTASTRFPIGSITKGMTALALMEAHDEGRFDPAKPVRAYLPWFSIHSGGRTIYAHQLLSHTGGTPDDFSFSPGYMYSVAALRGAHTIFAPGTSWSYSNDGLATTGAILSTIDGRPWAQSLQSRVFDALAMSHSSPVFTPETLSSAAPGYVFEEPNAITPPSPRLIPSAPGDFVDPAGSVISTPEDMAKYMRLILNRGVNDAGKRVLSAAAYRMWTTPDSNNGKIAGQTAPELAEAPQLYEHYAFGLAVHQEGGDTIVGHTGGIAGYSACMENDVTRGFGVIAMSNLVEAPLHPCAIVLYAIRVLQAQSAGAALPALPAKLGNYLQRTAVTNAASYAGTYTAPDGSTVRIAASAAGLSLQTPQGSKTLYPRGGDTFYVDDPRFTVLGLTFVRNKAGKIDEAVSGSQWFASAAYSGPRKFSYPERWNALTGRYESLGVWGIPAASRVYVRKGRLLLDGAPLAPQPDGSFKAGPATVRFDTPAAGETQRLRIDDFDLYRVDLP
ncbi:MAG TPA: serine hydrolase domain-containing protein [Candidatus Baltobacteraceae bacterium]|nr:serine hydrolase domain-containing protein [Candidatus Baltobacteraceae bacterium]